ncbi:terminase [Leptospira andrefontaineae]|uniref:Terminase n=1 Tax=Leptospira andrefontaineae TaxID=2484976 RepID=A0A4R9GWY1_9LEPT|nr:terminase [Leptospira andrefontaineae]
MALAVTEHRNEKNQKLIITPDDFYYELYQEAWDLDTLIMACTQWGKTEWAIVTMLALAEFGLAHFYVLPTENDRNKFLSGKLEKCISFSPYYQDRMRDLPDLEVDNKSMKIYGGVNLTFVGSNAPSGFTMVTADAATIDEEDQCEPANVPMAEERLSFSDYRIRRWISNPTHNGKGISKRWRKSDQRNWNIHHRDVCGHDLKPDFFKHVADITGKPYDKDWRPGLEPRLICDKCGRPVDRKGPGFWEKTADSDIRGYQVSKIFAGKVSLMEIIDRYKEGLQDDVALQRFYNGDLGLPYTAAGTQITKEILDANIDPNYRFPQTHRGQCLIGIDPGSRIHFSIWYQNFDKEKWDLVFAGWTTRKEGLFEVIARYNVCIGAIDAGPELQLVRDLKEKYPWMYSVTYNSGPTARTETKERVNVNDRTMVVNRTFEMDEVKSFFAKKHARLPMNIESHDSGDFYNHMQAPVRTYDEKGDRYTWNEGTDADHYFHTCVYFNQARKLWVYMRNTGGSEGEVRL